MAQLGYTWYPQNFNGSDRVGELSWDARNVYKELIDKAMLSNNKVFLTIKSWARRWNVDVEMIENSLNELRSWGLILDVDENLITCPECDSRIEKANASRGNGTKGGRPKIEDKITSKTGKIIPRHPNESDHYVYLFYRSKTKEYKIGETRDLFKRRQNIKAPTKELILIDFCTTNTNTGQTLERQIKESFKNKQIKGDWYDFSSSDLKEIVALFKSAEKPIKYPEKTLKEKKGNEIESKKEIEIESKIKVELDFEEPVNFEKPKDKFSHFTEKVESFFYEKRNHPKGQEYSRANCIRLYRGIVSASKCDPEPDVDEILIYFEQLYELATTDDWLNQRLSPKFMSYNLEKILNLKIPNSSKSTNKNQSKYALNTDLLKKILNE